MDKRIEIPTSSELHERNLIKVSNTRKIPGAGDVINVCDFNKKKSDVLDELFKKEL